MNQPWNMCSYNEDYNVLKYMNADSSSSLVVRPGNSFTSKTYINPSIVRCGSTLSNTDLRVIKNIHINPNFRSSGLKIINRTSSGNLTFSNEKTYVHVNPYFHHSKATGGCNFRFSGSSLPMFTHKTDLQQIINETRVPTFPRQLGRKNNLILDDDAIEDVHATTTSLTKEGQFQLNTTYSSLCQDDLKMTPSSQTCAGRPLEGEPAVVQLDMCLNNVRESIHPFSSSYSIKTKHKIINKMNLNSDHKKINANPKGVSMNSYNANNKNSISAYPAASLSKRKGLFITSTNASTKSKQKNMNVSPYTSSSNIQSKNSPVAKHNALRKLKILHIRKLKNVITSKYKYTNKKLIIKKRNKLENLHNSQYKLDKRTLNLHVQSVTTVLQKKVAVAKNKPDKGQPYSLVQSKFKHFNAPCWTNQTKPQSDVSRLRNVYPNKTVINIGGIMYKSTSNKLTRTSDKKSSVCTGGEFSLKSAQIRRSGKKHHIVYVRGEKYLLDNARKTLIRQPNINANDSSSNKNRMRRVDIGGITYIQKSTNVLIRTNGHHARHLVNHAKQRSIAVLRNKHKRNNMPCMIYHRFGRCERLSKGLCTYVHDPKNIALCKKFLKGECKSNNCLLSHNLVKEKMATCHFFLLGNCNRENCPYLHVKVSKKASVCLDFLQGYCSLGSDCRKHHIYLCPDFYSKGTCSKRDKCPYPHNHQSNRKRLDREVSQYKLNKKTTIYKKQKSSSPEETTVVLYENGDCIGKNIKSEGDIISVTTIAEKKNENIPFSTDSDEIVECIPQRIKLDNLPLFIPLDLNKSN